MKIQQIQLSDHFTYPRLLRFTGPSMVMMVFTSIYSVVDGFFVSNYVGKTPFAALNLIYPFIMILGALGFMVGTGGSAIVARTLGEGRPEQASRSFSMLIWSTIAGGLALTLLGLPMLRPISRWMGAEGEMLEGCVLYGSILLASLIPFMLQNVFQSFLITAERPKLGLAVIVAAGITNMVLDYFFVALFRWGLAGAAAATAASQAVGGLIPLFYFLRGGNPVLRLLPTRPEPRVLLATFANGSSVLLTNVSLWLVNILFNFPLMSLAGEDGVAAYGVIMYVNFVFLAVFIGYSIGSAPIVSYHYGAENAEELRGLLRKSVLLTALAGVAMAALSEVVARPLTAVFVGYDPELLELTCRGFQLYAISFLFAGFNIFGSAFFTALGDGLTSALISFLRTLLFQVASVLLLPLALGTDGIWLSVAVAELAALLVTAGLLAVNRNKYRYA